MEFVYLKVAKVVGHVARVHATSVRRIDGKPEASLSIVVRARKPLSAVAARDIALKYLDPA